MTEITTWINLEKTINKSKKGYAHFDLRTDISKSQNYINSILFFIKLLKYKK